MKSKGKTWSSGKNRCLHLPFDANRVLNLSISFMFVVSHANVLMASSHVPLELGKEHLTKRQKRLLGWKAITFAANGKDDHVTRSSCLLLRVPFAACCFM